MKKVAFLMVFLLVVALGATALAGRHHGGHSAARGQTQQATPQSAACPHGEACTTPRACQAAAGICPNGERCGADGTACPYGVDHTLDGAGHQGRHHSR